MARVLIVHSENPTWASQERSQFEETLDQMAAGSLSWIDLRTGLPSSTDSKSSPLWVDCQTCGADCGDKCHTPIFRYCEERIATNRKRLGNLDTWAIPLESGSLCHQTEAKVWLCWRSTEDLIEWSGVPCFAKGCDKTYAFELRTDGLFHQRIPIERLYPDLVEMTCWATEEEDPWVKS